MLGGPLGSSRDEDEMAADFVRAARRGDWRVGRGVGFAPPPHAATLPMFTSGIVPLSSSVPSCRRTTRSTPWRLVPPRVLCTPLVGVFGTRSVARSVNEAVRRSIVARSMSLTWMRRCVASRGWGARRRVTAHGAPARLPSSVNNGEGQIYQRKRRRVCGQRHLGACQTRGRFRVV